MELNIRDKDSLVDLHFGRWLITKLRAKILQEVTKSNLSVWDTYLNTTDDLTRLFNKEYTAAEIFLFAATKLVCQGNQGNITISIPQGLFVPGYDRLNLLSILKTINYGTRDKKGVPILTNSFRYFENNIQDFARLYYRT